ncbi:aminotransferase class I/II-fold pyridoxal phosphate-dependent enzyme [Mycolicibacterium boenickei]
MQRVNTIWRTPFIEPPKPVEEAPVHSAPVVTPPRATVVSVPKPVAGIRCRQPDPLRTQEPRFELALSENPFPPLPSVLDAISRTLCHAHRYPEFAPRELPQVIAHRVGVSRDQVVVGYGATGVAMQIMQALTAPGDDMVFSTPTYDGYPILANMVGLNSVAVPLDPQGNQDLHALRRAVTTGTSLVTICRPHNPTGTVVTEAELDAFLSAVPVRVPVIVDEAYAEFLTDHDAIDAPALVRRHPNVVVLRTFSKAYGLAGLRIGYAFGDASLVAKVRRLQLPFGVSATAVAAVKASYAAEAELRRRIQLITRERERLRSRLCALGIRVPNSQANFLYIQGSTIANRLAYHGISSKSYPDGSARVAVGDRYASQAILRALT